MTPVASIEAVEQALVAAAYIPTRQIATAVFLSARLDKPVLVEGPAGVGKTELALATSRMLSLPLIRMQCYDGLDESKALYEWKYGKQLLYTQILRDKLGEELRDTPSMQEALARLATMDDVFFSEQFLEPRPLLRALRAPRGAVLLIDEIDKADEQFEAFLLELLSDYQVTIPELGPIRALVPPIVFLTSNATRDLGDAMKRRCLHLHIGFPDQRLEERIVATRVPEAAQALRRQLVGFVQRLRRLDLRKLPSVSETIDWARALVLLSATELDAGMVRDTLNLLLKFETDVETAGPEIGNLVRGATG